MEAIDALPFQIFVPGLRLHCVLLPALARTDANKRQRLALVLRQLDAAVRISAPNAAVTDPTDRYTFDYDRLSTDLDLIRQGINGYLTPSRAQPRNPPELTGHYTRSIVDPLNHLHQRLLHIDKVTPTSVLPQQEKLLLNQVLNFSALGLI